jgi:poly(hydroxyalkanoate) depolymerase family esterase
MNTSFKQGLARATGLTRSGNLQEATALIQSLLQQGKAPADMSDADNVIDGDVIEGDFINLDTAPTPKARNAGHARFGTGPSTGPSSGPRTGSRSGRRPLSEVLRKIAAGGMPGHAPGATEAPCVPDGAAFLSLSHVSAAGSRDYRLYVPANAPDAPMPLIVMLHGCTQTPEDFATGTGMNALAEEFGCLVAYPGQPAGANAQKCWNWFRPEDQARGRGEPAIIAGIARDILKRHAVDPARVYAAGLSAGGAAAAILGNAYPDIFAAIGVHSGLPAGGAQDIPSAFTAMRTGAPGNPQAVFVPTIVFHGLSDQTVHPANGRAVLDRMVEIDPNLTRRTVRGATAGGRTHSHTSHMSRSGRSMAEHWEIDGAAHAWSGGQAGGSYTDPTGPDASREMLRFFLQHKGGQQ